MSNYTQSQSFSLCFLIQIDGSNEPKEIFFDFIIDSSEALIDGSFEVVQARLERAFKGVAVAIDCRGMFGKYTNMVIDGTHFGTIKNFIDAFMKAYFITVDGFLDNYCCDGIRLTIEVDWLDTVYDSYGWRNKTHRLTHVSADYKKLSA